MLIKITQSTLTGGVWHEPGIGNYSPELAAHLIGLGVAVPYENKQSTPTVQSKTAPAMAATAEPIETPEKKTTLTLNKKPKS